MSADLLAAFATADQELTAERGSEVRNGSSTSTERHQHAVISEQSVPHLDQGAPMQEHATVYTTNLRQDRGSQDPNVIFDTSDNDGESEEYGEFEVAAEDPLSSRAQVLDRIADLLGLDEDVGSSTGRMGLCSPCQLQARVESLSLQNTEVHAQADWGTFEEVNSPSTTTNNAANAPQKPPQSEQSGWTDALDEDWAELDDGGNTSASYADPNRAAHDFAPGQEANALPARSIPERPTNIPPPSRLLQVLPSIFHELSLKCTGSQPFDHSLAEHITLVYVTAARITAGRTWRWKRDKFLSQSMSLGPASSSALKGMKLRSVNKNESVKEDQEVVELMGSWANSSHKYNSVLGKATRLRHLQLSASVVPKKVNGPGFLLADHACGLCGLLRDERLARIDEDAEDLFGEYWTDHWGHTTCVEFWERYQSWFRSG